MHIINITVRNKIAVNPAQDRYVCGNSDYVVHFDFDAEWDAYENKTARFVKEDGTYQEQVFSGNDCPVPVISDTYKMHVGVYAGNLSTTTAAYVPCKKSILCGGGVHAAPAEDVYNQIMAKLNGMPPKTEEPHKQLVTDAEGKVAWEDRLAYETEREVVNLEPTELEGEDDDGDGTNDGAFFLLTPWLVDIKGGGVYEVTYNGIPYECIAVEVTENGLTFCVLGNIGVMGTPGGNPDAPFALVALPNNSGLGFYAMFTPTDGATSATISVRGVEKSVKPIDPKYIGKKTITITEDDEGNFTADMPFVEAWAMTPAELQSSIVIIAKPDNYNGNRQYTVESVGKQEGGMFGTQMICLRVQSVIPMDTSDSSQTDAICYINWVAGAFTKRQGYTQFLPRMALDGCIVKRVNGSWWPVAASSLVNDVSCVVNVTLDGSRNVTACDKTYAEVAEAIKAGKDARAVVKDASSAAMFLRLALTSDNTIAFNGTWISGSGTDALELAYNFVMTANGTNTFEQRTI